MKSRKVWLWCYPELAILGTILIFGTTACVIWINVVVGIEGITETKNDALLIRFFMSSLWGGLIIIMLSMFQSTFSRVVFTEKSISFKSPFHRTFTYPYEKYRYIYRGQYFHRNIFGQGVLVEFIIISQIRITVDSLGSANKIGNSAEIIKIRYSPKRYKKICAIIPTPKRVSLNKIFQKRDKETVLLSPPKDLNN